MEGKGRVWEVEVAPSITATFSCALDTPHWEVSCCDTYRVLHVRRHAVGMPDARAMLLSWAPIHELADQLPLETWFLCLDMRLAPPSHDPEVEQALRRSRARVSERTQRYAVILKSAAGVLHATRLVQPQSNLESRIFRDDVAGALRFLIRGE
ncbi:MAG: hypothetical protein AAF447_05830 [Myxococcota bacterium]